MSLLDELQNSTLPSIQAGVDQIGAVSQQVRGIFGAGSQPTVPQSTAPAVNVPGSPAPIDNLQGVHPLGDFVTSYWKPVAIGGGVLLLLYFIVKKVFKL